MLQSFQPDRWIDLGHYGRYALMWTRGSKKTIWLYIPSWLRLKIEKPISIDYINFKSYLDKHLTLKPKYIRKFWYQLALSIIKDRELVDFMQGRASLSIGSIHYDNLLAKADQAYSEILQALEKLRNKAH